MNRRPAVRATCGFTMLVFLASAIGSVSRAQESPVVPPIDFVRYVLSQDFAVEGCLLDDLRNVHSSAPFVRVRVTRVLAGTVETDTLTLFGAIRGRWPHGAPRRGGRVIGWGIHEANGMIGSLAVVGSRGDLIVTDIHMAGGPKRATVVDGRPVEEPGTLERFREAVARLKGQNTAEWLFSGDAIALVQVSAANLRDLSVHLVSWLAGSAGRAPSVVRAVPPSGRFLLASVGQRFVIPVPANCPDTLVAPLDRITACVPRGPDGWIDAIGMRMADLDQAGWHDSMGMHLKPIRRGGPGRQ